MLAALARMPMTHFESALAQGEIGIRRVLLSLAIEVKEDVH